MDAVLAFANHLVELGNDPTTVASAMTNVGALGLTDDTNAGAIADHLRRRTLPQLDFLAAQEPEGGSGQHRPATRERAPRAAVGPRVATAGPADATTAPAIAAFIRERTLPQLDFIAASSGAGGGSEGGAARRSRSTAY